MKFLKVNNKIKSISLDAVVFEINDKDYTFLRRVHKKIILWKLMKDGIYVGKEYANAYNLTVDTTK